MLYDHLLTNHQLPQMAPKLWEHWYISSALLIKSCIK